MRTTASKTPRRARNLQLLMSLTGLPLGDAPITEIRTRQCWSSMMFASNRMSFRKLLLHLLTSNPA